MPILSLALFGMRRRLFSTIFTLFSTTAILTIGITAAIWSYWTHSDQSNLKSQRSVAVFVEPGPSSSPESIARTIKSLSGVESAAVVEADEFISYLDQYFPDLKKVVAEFGNDILPKMVHVDFAKGIKLSTKRKLMASISGIEGAKRVDDGAIQVSSALDSLNWLSLGAGFMSISLWLILAVISFTHFQGVQFKEVQEIKLLRGFGASESWILLPWFVEALVYALFSALLSAIILSLSGNNIALLFNSFFIPLGYDSFLFSRDLVLFSGAVVFVGAFLAHVLGGSLALFRGKFV